MVEAAHQAAQGCVGQRFIPMVKNGTERSFALQGRQDGAQHRGHPQQRGKTSVESNAAKRGEDDQNDDAHAETNDHLS